MNKNKIDTKNFSSDTWVISSDKELALISKLKSNSISLFNYVEGKSYRGILTGLSEAFIIDESTKKRLISEDEKSAELIRPFLLGRDAKPFTNPIVKKFLILIPKGFTIRKNLEPDNPFFVSEAMHRYGNMEYNEAWIWFKTHYPSIAKHLLPFKEKAESRTDKGDFWWELRACDYYQEFEKPKIMYQVFQVKPCFTYDENSLFCNNSMWIIPKNDKFLYGILNSRIGWWLISKYCTAIQNGYQLIWKYFCQIPIVIASDNKKIFIESKVDQILTTKKINPSADTIALEKEIDLMVYELYGLTEDEIKIVEGEK
ncbi:MAG: hypothetical protein HGB12_13320 [Bacteroidetes bacterium]|nr:hypothetical protein [Bacteroidota bacterium]